MKKSITLLSALGFAVGASLLPSCTHSKANNPLQNPLETAIAEVKNPNGIENKNQVSAEKTLENMAAAFKGETTASAKYMAYSQKAEQEGYHEIAMLFKAASTAENIHANNHKAVLMESGKGVPVFTPEYTVKTTKENLQDAISGESYEASTMYPEFLKTANEAQNKLALISLNYAYQTEQKHKVLYEKALQALNSNSFKNLPSVYFVCSTCGNTYENSAPARCGISMTSSEKFIKI